jgi:hypothetical protein
MRPRDTELDKSCEPDGTAVRAVEAVTNHFIDTMGDPGDWIVCVCGKQTAGRRVQTFGSLMKSAPTEMKGESWRVWKSDGYDLLANQLDMSSPEHTA